MSIRRLARRPPTGGIRKDHLVLITKIRTFLRFLTFQELWNFVFPIISQHVKGLKEYFIFYSIFIY